MARRRKEHLVEVLAGLPWPAGIIVGVLGFIALRWGFAWYMGAFGGSIGKAMGAGFGAGALSPIAWLFLCVGLLGAALSFWRTRQRKELLEEQASLTSLRSMSWMQFEQLVGEAYRRLGYRIEETGQGGADGGIDLLLRKDGVTTLVQCKQWRTQKIGVAVVREMYGLMVHHNAAAVKIVCTGIFTSECEAFALDKPIELVDGQVLMRLVQNVKTSPSPSARETISRPRAPVGRVEPIPEQAPRSPSCPKCGEAMAERSNRANGQRFWGCTKFPGCRGTIAI